MKRLIQLTAIAVIAFTSCSKNLQEMVDKGQYDEAILYAAEKLQGEENKETKYVKSLEEAFSKVMARDLDRIAYMEEEGRPEYYGKIYNLYEVIEERQERIRPFLPLQSEDGYVATFEMIDPRPGISKYATLDSDYHYQSAIGLLNRWKPERKDLARDAYKQLREIDRYYDEYKDVEELKVIAKEKGIEYAILVADIANHMFIDNATYNDFVRMNINSLNRQWMRFHQDRKEDIIYDYEVIIGIVDVQIDSEKERAHTFHYEKEVEDGFTYVYDERGNVAKDSLGNDIKIPAFKTIRATVTEVERYKSAAALGAVDIYNLHNNRKVEEIPIDAVIDFVGFSCIVKGNKRAIDGNVKHKYDNFLEPFPLDAEMIYEGLMNIREAALKAIRKEFS